MIAFFIGIILGIIFFGGLYVTVQNLANVKHPAFLMTLSLIVRMGVLLGVLFYVSKGGYQDILLAMLGMILVRVVMMFKIKKPHEAKKGGE